MTRENVARRETADDAMHAQVSGEDPHDFWERRYSGERPIWSGAVNATLASVVEQLWPIDVTGEQVEPPGASLDLGCGEGSDVLWLAERGWNATGIDLSETAIGRARAAADSCARAKFVAADLTEWVEAVDAGIGATIDQVSEPVNLITASFLQSPVALPRERILRAALQRLAPGGRLVVLAHAAAPPWAKEHDIGHANFPRPATELSALGLSADRFEGRPSAFRPTASKFTVEVAEVRQRRGRGPDGQPASLEDTVVVVQRSLENSGHTVRIVERPIGRTD